MSIQIYDYTVSDYVVVGVGSSGNEKGFVFGGSGVMGVKPAANINGGKCTTTLLNSMQLKILFDNITTGMPSSSNNILEIVISNAYNPPMVGNYWLQADTYSSVGNIK